MKKVICLLAIGLICVLLGGAAVTASPSPYSLQVFDNAAQFVDWLYEVNDDTVDIGNHGDYTHAPMVNAIRGSDTIILPKYEGEYFPKEKNAGRYNIAVWPRRAEKYWGAICFESQTQTKTKMIIHDIHDSWMALADADYGAYIKKRYLSKGVGIVWKEEGGTYHVQRIANFDVFKYTKRNERIETRGMESAFEFILPPLKENTFLEENFGALWPAATLLICGGLVLTFVLVRKKGKTAKTQKDAAGS